MACSPLRRSLMGSLGLGLGMYLYRARPVVPSDHSFIHFSWVFCRMSCFAVLYGTGLSGCSSMAPFLASMSALSLLEMSTLYVAWDPLQWEVDAVG